MSSKAENEFCPACGAPVSAKRLRGQCARCLMRGITTPAGSIESPPSAPDGEAPEPHKLAGTTEAESNPRDTAPVKMDALHFGAEGFRIPGHVILRELARGGMGIVYQARQLEPEREVAVKMLLPQMITEEMRGRFRLEARAMADLNHPGILPLHQFGEWAGLPFFTMKLASGGTLAARTEAFAGQWRRIAALLADLADAVAHAHDRGVLHRDLKPGNILFDAAGRAYVADFGLVKIADTDSQWTRSTGMLGTPQYLAPEVASGGVRMATVRSDVYSLGAVLYELLAGKPPFRAENLTTLLREIAEKDPPSLRKQGTPRDLATVALCCLAKAPARRYASAAELAADLRAWLAGQAIRARAVSSVERLWLYARRHPALSLVSLLLAGSVVMAAVLQHRANLSLKKTTQEALTAQVHAVRQSGQWDLRDAGLKAAKEAAKLENTLALRNDAITLLATPSCQELDRRPFSQPEWAPITPDGKRYAEVKEQRLWLRVFDPPASAASRVYPVQQVQAEAGAAPSKATHQSQPPAAEEEEEEIPPPPLTTAPMAEAAAFSGNGQVLMVRMENHSYHLWLMTERKWADAVYQGVWGLALSEDGRRIAYGRNESTEIVIEEWAKPEGSRKLKTLTSDFKSPAPTAFSPDGQLLAVTAEGEGKVEIHNPVTGDKVYMVFNPIWDKGRWPTASWRADSGALAVNSGVLDVSLWHLDGPQPFGRRLSWDQSEVRGIAWHPRGEWLATCAFEISLREISSGRVGFQRPGYGKNLQFSQDGTLLFLHDDQRKELVRYRLDLPQSVRHVALPRTPPDEGLQRGPWGLDLSPDGRLAVVGGALGVSLLDAAAGRVLARLSTGVVNSATFTKKGDGLWLAAPGQGLLRCALSEHEPGTWTLSPPKVYWANTTSAGRVDECAATGLLGATFGNDLWILTPAPDGTPAGVGLKAQNLSLPGVVMNPLTLSPDGRWAVSAPEADGPGDNACVWDLKTRTLARRLPDTPACRMVFSPDSRTLFTASVTGLCAWDTTTWTPRWIRNRAEDFGVHRIPALSGDGHTLAVARNTHGVGLIDPATGATLAVLDHPDPRVICWLALDFTGARLAVNGTLENIQLWDLRRLRDELAAVGLDWPAPPLSPPLPRSQIPVRAVDPVTPIIN